MGKPPQKLRLDQILVLKGLASDVKEAQALVLAGQVSVPDHSPPLKAGLLLPQNTSIRVRALARFVSRGGEKLKAALDFWGISIKNQICLDVGVSTGGFTDCLLQGGAAKVYGVEVGRGQAHPKIRGDARVELREETHFLKWMPPWLMQHGKNASRPSVVVLDLSFISLKKILPRLYQILITRDPLLEPGALEAEVLALVKPQFEVEPRFIVKGIVKSAQEREMAVSEIVKFAEGLGFERCGRFPCPVFGAKGNQEEWIRLRI